MLVYLSVLFLSFWTLGCGGTDSTDVPPQDSGSESPAGPEWLIAETDVAPGNPAVAGDGSVFFSVHPATGPEVHVMRVVGEDVEPWPSLDAVKSGGDPGISAIIGIQVDMDNKVYMLDMGPGGGEPARLLIANVSTPDEIRVVPLPADVMRPASFMQDFALDTERGKIYIADMAVDDASGRYGGAIVTLDIESGQAWRAIAEHDSFWPDSHTNPDAPPSIVSGTTLRRPSEDGQGTIPWIGLNPITIDTSYEWVYFGGMHGTTLWRVPAASLADPEADAAEDIERWASKPYSDGISIDSAGNVYVTDIENNAVCVIEPGTDECRILIQDGYRLIWPDGLSCAPDGSMVVAANELNRYRFLNNGEMAATAPWHLLGFEPLAPCVVGR